RFAGNFQSRLFSARLALELPSIFSVGPSLPLTFDHRTPLSLALALSLALHVTIGGALRRSSETRAPEPAPLDNWSANSLDVGVALQAPTQPLPSPPSDAPPETAPARAEPAAPSPQIVLPRPHPQRQPSQTVRTPAPRIATSATNANLSASSDASATPG